MLPPQPWSRYALNSIVQLVESSIECCFKNKIKLPHSWDLQTLTNSVVESQKQVELLLG
jgi:hypothetical protein